MKKKLLVLISIITMLCGCESKEEENIKIGKPNKKDETVLQLKVTNDFINIRTDPNLDGEIIGQVSKGDIYTVIDYKIGDKYIWSHIKTSNKIEGYIASDKESPYYKFINEVVDYLAPTLEISVEQIEVDSYSKITDEYIKEIVKYEDDQDENPKFIYEVIKSSNYNYPYYLYFKVVDFKENVKEAKIPLKVTNEKLASNGKWVTRDDVRNLRKKFQTIEKKYGEPTNFITLTNNLWRMDFGNETTIMVFTDSSWFYGCTFIAKDENITPSYCNDDLGNISYEEMKSKIAKQEVSAKNAYNNIKSEFEKNGYKINDLFLYE